MDDDMRLPVGKICLDCAFYNRCKWLFGCKPDSTECNWAPSRFKPNEDVKAIADTHCDVPSFAYNRRIDDLGRIAIPKSYRQVLGIKEGDELEIQLLPNGVFITQSQ